MPDPQKDAVETLRGLIASHVVLGDIGVYELGAHRGIVVDGVPDIVGPGIIDEIDVGEPAYGLDVYWSPPRDKVLVRLWLQLDTDAGHVRAGVQAEYTLDEDARSSFDTEVEKEFVNRVAVMALLPYLRAAISDISGRVFGTALTMPIVSPDELIFTLENRSQRPDGHDRDS